MKTVLLCCTIFLAGCSRDFQIVPSVRAQSPIPAARIVQWNGWAGDVNEICQTIPNEQRGYLLLKLAPCSHGVTQDLSYTLVRELHVTAISSWMGTPPQQLFELISHLEIETPDGHAAQFMTEYDKHNSALPGMLSQSWNVDLHLPIGTVLKVHRTFGGVLSCPAQPSPWPDGCLTEIHWRLYGSF